MPSAMLPAQRLRIVSRKKLRPKYTLPPLRPSWLNPYARGDLWLEPQDRDWFVLCFNYHPLAYLKGSPLDWIALNQTVFQLRHRPSRQRSR